MFKNYIKIALRNIKRHKGYSFINIAGLTAGMACVILIFLWVQHELSYDKFHKNAGEIYRVFGHSESVEGGLWLPLTPPPLAQTLKSEFPGIVDSTRLRLSNDWLVTYGEKSFMEDGFAFVDPSFFKIFTFPFIKGDPLTALSNQNSIVITRRIAKKYFGEKNPVGKTIKADNKRDFLITGVIKDIPENSHIKFDFIASFMVFVDIRKIRLNHWSDNSYYTYVQIQKGASYKKISEKITNVQKERNIHSKQTLALQPLTDIHLHSSFLNYDWIAHGDIKYVYLFSILAMLVLIVASINYMGLTTARGAGRAKEVGMRKVTGADRRDIIKQFFGESIFMTLIALVLAAAVASFLLPVFNSLSGKHLTQDIFGNLNFILGLTGIALVTGILSGSYPALFLSSFKPVTVLKGNLKRGGKSSRFRKVLVIAQFAISGFLIISTMVVYKQLGYIQEMKLGYDKEHMIYMPVRGDIRKNYETVKKELLKNSNILNVTNCSDLPTSPTHLWGNLFWPDKDPKTRPQMNFFSTDFDFIKSFKIKMVAGRDFSKDLAADSSNYIINEAAAKYMGMTEPVGKWFARGEKKGYIIGVMKDFHFNSARKKVGPLVLQIAPSYYYIFVKVKPRNIPGTITYIEDTWIKFNPLFPMEYFFLDEAFERVYRSDQQLGNLFKYFTILAIFISCLGLVGLASFMAQERTKEIGIRKVLGSSVSEIVMLLSKEFMILVVLSNIIAWPTAFFCMNKWLQNWEYHTNLNIIVFVFTAVISLTIAFFTVGYQSIKAARVNPVEALRYE